MRVSSTDTWWLNPLSSALVTVTDMYCRVTACVFNEFVVSCPFKRSELVLLASVSYTTASLLSSSL